MEFYNDISATLAAPPPWSAHSESAVLEPFTYLTSNPGKEVVDRLLAAFDVWMAVPPDARALISKAVNMLHNASMIVDDIEDDSPQPAHTVYGIPQTLNAANYVYFLAYQEILDLKRARLSLMFPEAELLCLHRGQGLDLHWRDSFYCPTEEEYVHMANNKTTGLLRIEVKLMMACATTNVDVDYVPLMNLIGIFYQIRDDLMNLQSPVYSSTKGFAEDLTEGKFSFPVVHGIHADPSNHQILEALKKRPTTPTLKLKTIEYLRTQTKSFEYTLEVLDKLEAQVRAEIARLGGNKALEKIVDALHVDSASLGQ
ncbi:isoprenoid synthase domain-containing protein [Mycena vulgaris]|nr:isoprenoid synthase domain-containing protein [Mycena vulgaris]